MKELVYAHDPMCSWCWAFAPSWEKIQRELPTGLAVRTLLGGLAPDSAEPMPEPLQQHLQGIWRQIMSHVPGTQFNFDFWTDCTPRRSTWPACRAMIVAGQQQPGCSARMSAAIQQAYYLDAQNPSDDSTLIALAESLALDPEAFAAALHSDDVRAEHNRQMEQCRSLGMQGFPSLALVSDGNAQRVALDHNNADVTLNHLRQLI